MLVALASRPGENELDFIVADRLEIASRVAPLRLLRPDRPNPYLLSDRSTEAFRICAPTAERVEGTCFSESTVQLIAMVEPIVVVDPEVMNGTPCFRGTRVPFKNLIDYLEGGHSLGEFLQQFPTVTREMAVQALEEAKDSLLARIA
jgi:uncharacterized protein (DUF433 family)